MAAFTDGNVIVDVVRIRNKKWAELYDTDIGNWAFTKDSCKPLTDKEFRDKFEPVDLAADIMLDEPLERDYSSRQTEKNMKKLADEGKK